MLSTRTSLIRFIRWSVGIGLLVIIVGYALLRSVTYVQGPEIVIIEPGDRAVITATTTQIRGRVLRANNVSLNGMNMFIDEQGNFSETVIAFKGTNILTLEARDHFGRQVNSVLHLHRSQ